jgi:hypothetical protein
MAERSVKEDKDKPKNESGLDLPELTESGKPTRRPIANSTQALSIIESLISRNQIRADRNFAVADHYGGAPPFDQKKLEKAGENWRANVPTMTMTAIIDRSRPRFVDAIHRQKYLISASLPKGYDKDGRKANQFREITTNKIRIWGGYADLIDGISQENILIGHTAVVWLDPVSWRPRTFKQEDLLFEDGTPQHESYVKLFGVRVNYDVDELLDIIDRPEAEEAGFDVDNLIAAVEGATMERIRSTENPRELSDAIREGSMYYSKRPETKTIETYHLFVKNYEDGVDHWWVLKGDSKPPGHRAAADLKDEGKRLAFFENEYESMNETLSLFSFEVGNRKLYGSKGLGRALVNLNIAVDRATCAYIDGHFLGTLRLAQCSPAELARMRPRILQGFCWFPAEARLPVDPFKVNHEAYVVLRNILVQTMELIAGAYIPAANPMYQETKETATKTTIDAQKEREVEEGVMNRYFRQIMRMTSTMARRMYSVDTIKKAAKRFKQTKPEEQRPMLVSAEVYDDLKALDSGATESLFAKEQSREESDHQAILAVTECLEAGISPIEIYLLAHSGENDYSRDITAQHSAAIIQLASIVVPSKDPDYDLFKLKQIATSEQVGHELADLIMIPPEDNTADTEAKRLQIMEYSSMMDGEPVPVSPRDNHPAHSDALVELIAPTLEAWVGGPPEAVDPAMLQSLAEQVAPHWEEHLAQAVETGLPKEAIKAMEEEYKTFQKALNDIGKKLQAAQQAAEQEAQAQAALEEQALQQEAAMQEAALGGNGGAPVGIGPGAPAAGLAPGIPPELVQGQVAPGALPAGLAPGAPAGPPGGPPAPPPEQNPLLDEPIAISGKGSVLPPSAVRQADPDIEPPANLPS